MRIIGIHPVEAPEPCFLLEVELPGAPQDYDWGNVAQEEAGQPRDNWQVPWDERPLDAEGIRWAFFFHYLDVSKPLLTPDGPIALPTPTPVPAHLQDIEYEEP